MRRFDLSDITELHFRQLKLLIVLKLADAHIIVSSKRPWPSGLRAKHNEKPLPQGDAIN